MALGRKSQFCVLLPGLKSTGDLLEFERLHHIPSFDILKILQAHAALILRHSEGPACCPLITMPPL